MLLLDTHVFLWSTDAVDRVGSNALNLIEEASLSRQIYLSAITFWEIAMLIRKGKTSIPQSVAHLRSRALERGIQEIPIDGEIGIRSVLLDDFHKDPADRIIIATALGGFKLLTADRKILHWQGQLHRIDARV